MAKRILFFIMMPKTKTTTEIIQKAISKYFILHFFMVVKTLTQQIEESVLVIALIPIDWIKEQIVQANDAQA